MSTNEKREYLLAANKRSVCTSFCDGSRTWEGLSHQKGRGLKLRGPGAETSGAGEGLGTGSSLAGGGDSRGEAWAGPGAGLRVGWAGEDRTC